MLTKVISIALIISLIPCIAFAQGFPSSESHFDYLNDSKPGFCDSVRRRLQESRKIIAKQREEFEQQFIRIYGSNPVFETNLEDFANDLQGFGRRIADNECPSIQKDEAISLLLEASALGNTEAKLSLARIYWEGRNAKPDNIKANYWFSSFILTSIQYKDHDRKEELTAYLAPPSLKDIILKYLQGVEELLNRPVEEHISIARDLRDGNGIPQDALSAYRWMERAATAGSDIAKREMASMIVSRKFPVPDDSGMIEESLTFAAREGNVPAMLELAHRKAYGDQLFKNEFEAYTWLLRARRQDTEVPKILERVSRSLNIAEILFAYLKAYDLID